MFAFQDACKRTLFQMSLWSFPAVGASLTCGDCARDSPPSTFHGFPFCDVGGSPD